MNTRSLALATLFSTVTLTLTVFGCAEPGAADFTDLEDEPTLETRGDHGSNGTNGLSNVYFAAFSSKLATAARKHPLVNPGTMDVSDGVRTKLQLETSQAGQTVFEYAMRCVLPGNMQVRVDQTFYAGLGHLPNGKGWLEGPLPESDIEDLLACMAVHVNPYGLTVPILLLGPRVKDDSQLTELFNVPEALWISQIAVDDVPSYVVWPSDELQRVCASNIEKALQNRLCGQQPGDCNLKLGDPEDCRYDEAAGGHYCLGQPAIETRLLDSGVPFLYQLCQ